MLQALELSAAWHRELKDHAEALAIEFMSTPFDVDSLSFLVGLGVRRLKIASGELTNAPFIWQFGRAGLPVILSTGMSTLAEVETALAVLCHALSQAKEPNSLDEVWNAWSVAENRQRVREMVTVLHCTSQYPSPANEINLRAMGTVRSAFDVEVGYSDHSMGIVAPIAAVSLGATMIEKHFTLDRNLEGPDHKASLLPEELATMIDAVREVEAALGCGGKVPQPSEWDTRAAARQTIIASRPIAAGQEMIREDLATARCGSGLLPTQLWDLVGRRATRAYQLGDVLEP
jgi:N-acetylneuraminate synthase